MINLVAFIHSLKITWIRRLIKSAGKWNKILEEALNLKHVFHFGDAYLELQMPKLTNMFWKDVLDSYRKLYVSCTPLEPEQLLLTPLFHNNIFNKFW